MENYGFILDNVCGVGIKRYFNSETIIISDNKEGKLPFSLHQINLAQSVMTYKSACNYCRNAAIEYGYDFRIISEEEYMKVGTPISNFFKKAKKWLKSGNAAKKDATNRE